MAGTPYLDLLGESKGSKGKQPPPSPASLVRAPVTDAKRDAAAKQQIEASRQRMIDEKRVTNLSAVRNEQWAQQKLEAETHARLMADPGPEGQEYRARYKRIHSAGIDWGLIPMGAKVIGTGAAIIATGGAAAGALGVTAAAGAVTTATAVSQAAGALEGATRGKVPTGALSQLGGNAVASLNLPAAVKVKVPTAKDAVAAVKAATATPLAGAAKQVGSQVKGAVVAAAGAPKIKTPSVPTIKAVVNQASAIGASLGLKPPTSTSSAITTAIGAGAGDALAVGRRKDGTVDTKKLSAQLRGQLGALALSVLEKTPNAKLQWDKQGRVSVSSPKPAATTSAQQMFSTAVSTLSSTLRPLVASATGVKPPAIAVPNKTPKPPTAGPPKPPPSASVGASLSSPPPALPVMADTVRAPTSSPAPTPPPTAAPGYPAPVVRGFLVKLDGTIDVNESWRAA